MCVYCTGNWRCCAHVSLRFANAVARAERYYDTIRGHAKRQTIRRATCKTHVSQRQGDVVVDWGGFRLSRAAKYNADDQLVQFVAAAGNVVVRICV